MRTDNRPPILKYCMLKFSVRICTLMDAFISLKSDLNSISKNGYFTPFLSDAQNCSILIVFISVCLLAFFVHLKNLRCLYL